jgi:glycosyltransferase involved in cell wall biosynthesis
MRFTVILPSFLGEYSNAASRRPEKLIRAVDSVIAQTFQDWELLVVADGCQETVDIMKRYTDKRIHCHLIPKAPMWDGKPRNTGIEKGKGEYIVYIDGDDYWGDDHLKGISDNLAAYDWVYFNDYVCNPDGSVTLRNCDIKRLGANGTSNICHRRSLDVRWGHRGYAHDHYFNQKLLFYSNHKKITAGEYVVMHLPNGTDL